MSQTIIADTSALISLLSKDDHNHQIALTIAASLGKYKKTTILPGEIITEFMNILGKKAGHAIAITRGNILMSSEEYSIVDTSTKIRDHSFEIFKKQPESVSFTDCLVMAFADEYETKEIFGFDETFSKNGYIRFGVDDMEEG